MDPPPCVQNAMMKQDKKPFTYTPGGLDLSEIRSPRMARRIERNANYTGAPEAPRPPPPPTGPLPPSALAAMQPQMHVQVFPTPSPPGPRAGPPPPPPPPPQAPRPPPPPSEPLPTQKVVTNDNQVLERPDMTKIIPDNPMSLLRKTGGPQPRPSLLDEAFGKPQQKQQQQQLPAQQLKQQWSPPAQQQQQQQWSPPLQKQQWSPVVQQQQPQPQTQRWPQVAPPQPQPNNQAPAPQPEPPKYHPKIIERTQQPSPTAQAEPPRYQPKIIERNEDPVVKTSTAHLGSLYIPPITQQQPPSPPKRDSPQIQSPSTPTLKEAPRPWQKQQKQAEELPPWAKKEEQNASPNAVYVTQPLVFQHPGPRVEGAVVIPVQIEKKPTTPGNERSLNRQQSWTPPQSNAFKVIQKITQTDGDVDEDNAPVIEHGPKYPQQFQQAQGEQLRKLKLTEGDRELMNRFRQGVDDDTSLHNEVDPRYRGAAIPSKAFRLLQSMTDGSPDTAPAVSRGPPAGNRTPQVRNIPIQIERDEPREYVHPSEQTVPEPKKYTGSSIPSRSFKILQAMTAPDNCANANEVNENYDPSSCAQWGYDPNYPNPVPPFWPDYYCNYYYPHPNTKEQNESNDNKDNRQTHVPFWGYYPPPYPYMCPPKLESSDNETGRNTPIPYWGYYPYYKGTEEWGDQQEKDTPSMPPPYHYPHYWDPYYGYSYYGYPPMYSPYPFYEQNESDEVKTPQILITPSLPETTEASSDQDSDSSQSEDEEQQMRSNGLQAIRSVKDISVYDNSDEEPMVEECEEADNDDSSSFIDENAIPHQLSVIFEVSETSDCRRESSVLSDSTTIADRSDDERSIETPQQTEAVIISDENVIPDDNQEEEQDWWEILNKDDDVLPVRAKTADCQPEVVVEDDDDQSSTSSSDSSSDESSKDNENLQIQQQQEELGLSSEPSDDDSESSEDENNNTEAAKTETKEPLSIKERIQALRDSINSKRGHVKVDDDDEAKSSVKDKVSAIEAGNLLKATSTKSSVKSFEEFSEEEGDSGVTSDMSRHISDNEEFPELRKMSRYQRAATHSRLFKLLQEVCESDEEDDGGKEEVTMRRDQLTLPLAKSSDDSFSSSGITSPGSPVNDRLVTELVQSILKRKKGEMFRNMPKEKLQAAAKRILQEELDDLSTPDSSFLSPMRDTETSTPAQTPQEFYNDYKQYYDSWKDAESYDIMPSKAFKLLSEHSGCNKTGAIAGLLAKCPKILSSKNVHQELLKLMDESCESHPSPEPGEVSSAS